jgi:DNA-binding NtrC family response regulator
MAKVLVVDDEPSLRMALGEIIKTWNHEPLLAENISEALDLINTAHPDILLADVFLPDGSGIDLMKKVKEDHPEIPVVILTGHGSIEDAVQAIHLGAENYLTKPVEPPRLKLALDQLVDKRQMEEEVQQLRKQLKKAGTMGGLKGRSPAMMQLYSLIERVAPTEASVFITGESGTGKTLIAKTVHDYSRRRTKPFVAVNCAAIAPTLIESELFGHEKGAFTGATQQRRGYFEEAYGGTIFLDEITELPIELQGKLLRVLEENRIRRVGGNQEVEINVRIVSASNRDPKKAIEDGKLREDLYYRINIFPVHACALRERRTDIPFLSQMFLERLCEEESRDPITFEENVLKLLMAYDWPGNVRELRNVINRALIIAGGDKVTMDCMPDYLKHEVDMEELEQSPSPLSLLGDPAEDARELAGVGASTSAPAGKSKRGSKAATAAAVAVQAGESSVASGAFDPSAILDDQDMTLENMERIMIKKLLEDLDGNKPQVADKLGVSLKTLYNKIRKYGL